MEQIDSGLPTVAAPYGLGRGGGAEYLSASDEHGRVLVADPASPTRSALQLGAKLRLIPGHCDPTVNMCLLQHKSATPYYSRLFF